MDASFFNKTGESQGKVALPDTLFGAPGSRYVLHEAVIALQRNRRRGTSNTKTRGEVRGGGHKPWKQKGTGNARAGSIRSPLWRKGGIIFGPHPRSYRMDLSNAKKWGALQSALIEKAKASHVNVIESLPVSEGKTREAKEFLKKTGLGGRLLLVVDQREPLMARATRNVFGLELKDVRELNAWNIMAAKEVLFTQAALEALSKRTPNG